ncbi:SpoIIE family protein phosphatase [candidate division KSB1 bacterium]|nr:SpoIIE family protein phosphatase [candidate division KSB1 bacterium]
MSFLDKIWIKISLAIVVLIFIIMSLVSYFFTIRQLKFDRDELRENMGLIAKQIASIRLAETEGWYVYQDWIDNIIASDIGRDLVYIAIFDQDKNLAAFGINYNWLDLGANNYPTREEQVKIVESLTLGQVAEESIRDFDHFSVNIHIGRELLGTVDVGFSLIDFNNKSRQQILINLYLLILFLLLGIIASVILGKRMTKPIINLSQAMLAVSKGHFDLILHFNRNDEIGALGKSFNYMTSRLREKNVIENFSRQLGFTYEYGKVIQVITKQIVSSSAARFGLLFTIYPHENKNKARLARIFPESVFNHFTVELDDDSIQNFVNEKAPFYPLEKNNEYGSRILSKVREGTGQPDLELIIPLVTQEKLHGFFILTNKENGNKYDTDEFAFLSTLSHQAGMALENAYLLRELTEKERLKKELEIARNVQKRLLPQADPQIHGLDISGICIPAEEVGGDYFDYFKINENQIGLVIADVAGKGTSAAFYMAEIKGMMTSLAFSEFSPKKLLTNINKRLCQTLDKKVFATMIYGLLDVKQRQFKFVRAGHNALIVKRNGTNHNVEMFIPTGIALGLTDSDTFELNLHEEVVILNNSDTLILYTDGITEAMNKNFSEFSEVRLVELLEKTTDLKTSDLKNNILTELHDHTAGVSQNDDITMILARFV